jgi:deoxyribodipyrimidine photo-lyase
MSGFAVAWLRNDLRLADNPVLAQAVQTGLPVVAVFIATPATWTQHQMAPIKQDLIRRRINALRDELAGAGLALLNLEASTYQDCSAVFAKLAGVGAKVVFAQTEYELREQERDRQVAAVLQRHGVPCHFIDSQCVMPPGSVLSKTGETYKVFTPFKKTWLARLQLSGVHCLAKPKAQQPVEPQMLQQLAQSIALPSMLPGDNSSASWAVSEADVLEMLRSFCRERVADYKQQRDFPAVDGTSALSPYLAIGVISAQQAVARLQLEAGEAMWREGSGSAVWLSELIWREFYKHILVAYPNLIKHQPFQHETNAIVWGNNERWFQAWCDGQTGYPIVDAAMRQLNSTGWMHNRLRMIVASFLVKDLQIDWRWGEAYFMSKLIDGDFAANNGGWQWAASTGTDAAPYFRIFNPVTQSEKFDPQGTFLRRFLPELAKINSKSLHWPHPLPLGVSYAKPVVDHAKARLKTLEMFKAARGESMSAASEQSSLFGEA